MNTFLRNTISKLYNAVSAPVEGEQQQKQEDIVLTPHEHERALKRAYRSFVKPGLPRTDIDSYFD